MAICSRWEIFSLDLSNISARCFGIQYSTSLSFAEMYLSSRLSSGMNDAAMGGDISLWILFPSSPKGRPRSSSTP